MRTNLFLQFSVTSFVIMVILAVTIAVLLRGRLDNDIQLLQQHGAAMMAGTTIEDTDPFSIPSLTADVHQLQWITIGLVAGGFVVLYGALALIVWKGWKNIKRHQAARAQLQHETEERRQLAESLNRVSNKLNSTLEYQEVLDYICQECCDLMGVSGVNLWVVDGDEVVRKAGWFESRDEPERTELRQPLGADNPMISARVVKNRKAEIVNDTLQAPSDRVNLELVKRMGCRALMVVPLLKGSMCLGTVTLIDTRDPHRFTQKDLEVALAFASHAVTALENARLYQETLESQRLSESLNRISVKLNSTLDYQEVLDAICQECCDLTGVSGVNIWVVEGEEIVRKVGWFQGCREPERAEMREPLDRSSALVSARVARTGQPEILNNALAGDPLRANLEVQRHYGA